MAQAGSRPKDLASSTSPKFPVGVEYYRAPVPPMDMWEEDFRRIRASGMRIVRSFTGWDWMEPKEGVFQLEDIDRFFELAARNDLRVWLDTPVGTHMACPDWLIRKYPDMRVVWRDGSVQQSKAIEATPQGAMIHNFDHPQWRLAVERLMQELVPRYRDHPAMHIWGTWEGINFASAWGEGSDGYPPYNDYTIERFRRWLHANFTLDELNQRLLRRYRSFDEVQPSRSEHSPVEIGLYRRFHFENMADHLGWLAELIDALDGKHEQRSHGTYQPRAWDELCSARVDGWGLSHPSPEVIGGPDRLKLPRVLIGYQWSRAIGRGGRWWNEEIYSGATGGLRPATRQPLPEELSLLLWLSLIEGAAGALYWQYRPEYMSFEAPGLSLAALDGTPTDRMRAVTTAIAGVEQLSADLPLRMPEQDVAVVYSGQSHEIHRFGADEESFRADLLGWHAGLWRSSYASEVVSTTTPWSRYRVVVLPSLIQLEEQARTQLRESLQSSDGPIIVASGRLAMFSPNGHWSFAPPDELGDLVAVRVVDIDQITTAMLEATAPALETEHGSLPLVVPTQYAILEPGPGFRSIATLGGRTVAVARDDGRFCWYGLPLGSALGDTVPAGLLHAMLAAAGIAPRFELQPDAGLVAYERWTQSGEPLLFVANPEAQTAAATVRWSRSGTAGSGTPGGSASVRLGPGEVRVLRAPELNS